MTRATRITLPPWPHPGAGLFVSTVTAGWRVWLLAMALTMVAPGLAHAADRLQVVATFSVLADIVRQVGGDRVDVVALVGPDSDAHAYTPAPRDIAAVARADVLVSNGLGFEGWIDRLREASQFRGRAIVASQDVTPRPAAAEPDGHDGHDHDDHAGVDPHAFQNPANAAIYAQNIASGLCAADPAGCPEYRRNTTTFERALYALNAEIGSLFGALPPGERIIVMPHAALGYFADAYGLTVLAAAGPSASGEPSASDMAGLIRTIRSTGARALFLEGQTGSRVLEQVARETGMTIAGRLYTDALTGPEGPAPTLIAMFRHNARAIANALTAAP